MNTAFHHVPDVIETKEIDDGKIIELCLYMPKTLVYFQGHFPSNPILPGVAQLDIAINYAVSYLNLDKSRFESVKQIKFMKIIQPNAHLKLLLSMENNQLCFRYFVEDTVYSSGIISLSERVIQLT
ncbi:MAG: hypothetical protein HKM04_03640 [Legionellales bacterium]|nr:hypothetical protein [Legionellales bacterium]